MNNIVTQFAAETAEKEDVLTGLGIDFNLLALQLVAFLILVWVLSKYVYPVFLKIVDERQAKIDESIKAAANAEKNAAKAETAVEDALKEARKEAAEIVTTAKTEAGLMIEKAEKSAKSKTEHIVAQAQAEIEKDIASARKSLEKETLTLVKQAASLATAGVADSKLDTALVKQSVAEAKQ